MDLEGMARCRGLAVIANGNGEEVIFDIGIFDAGTRANEAAALEMIGGAEARLEQQPFDADEPLGKEIETRQQRDRLERFHLEIDFEMVLQILPNARQIVNRLDADRFEMSGITDARN